ncbi:sigma 54-interacting transcriptional regulator [Phormidium sp. LEGE 05292]|uniref:sigma 54-interacting transcriptional regulator n=1 Tax=[Phormidium] sp. LEGE 05292 TaxID=767427 RepID=UPI00187DFB5E|nr:sigma 54-interacting transcriptional regulator [Phormidium sp. LEGE 05292]MBE9227364.1 sigma 54-interacting transcriptional regulator [Phormidium sp. LEGE 05292]
MDSQTVSIDRSQSQLTPTLAQQTLPLGAEKAKIELVNEQLLFEWVNWLSSQRIWMKLKQQTLTELVYCLQYFTVEAGTPIYQKGHIPLGFYLLKFGTVEISHFLPVGHAIIRYHHPGELFGYANLTEDCAEVYQSSAIALSTCEIGFLSLTKFAELSSKYPDFLQTINCILADELNRFTLKISHEKTKIQSWQPYIQPVPKEETILGSSKATQKLASQIQEAAKNLQPVVFQAQPGTGKTFLAGMIHTHSELADRPFIEIDCAELLSREDGTINTDILFGKVGKQSGIIALLESGTLLIDHVQLLKCDDRDRLIHYLKTGYIIPNTNSTDIEGDSLNINSDQLIQSNVRLILASPNSLELPEIKTIQIKLFTLNQRKADIPEFANYFLEKCCRESDRPTLHLNRANLRRLLSYNYPGNLTELAEIIHRAVLNTPTEETTIPEQLFWSVQSEKNAFRVDLLNHIIWLRPLLLSRWYPEGIWGIMMAIFIPTTLLGFFGPQTRDSSITLNLFWAWWWPMYLFLFAYIGRFWCTVCPFMIAGEWIRRFSLWLFPRQQLPWNHKWLNRWGAWILFGGFVAIYLWEQLWDLPHKAYLSAWLLTIIALGAVIFSLIYERRLWCRHLCPIGGMNGLFAKLSLIELRSSQQICGSQCQTSSCYKGSKSTAIAFGEALPTEGQATEGCPLYSHPAQLTDNRDCMLCMSCLKGCPNRSPQLNLRFPASDLLDHHRKFAAEAALLLLLLGGVFMHHSHKILTWLGWSDLAIDSEHLLISIPVVILLLSIPTILTYFTHAIARWQDPEMPDYLTVIYAYLPFTLAANLAYYIPSGITEAGKVLPVFARTLGYSGVGLPTLTWSADVAAFLQGVTLLSALVFSIYPLLRITQRPWLSNLPHFCLLIALVATCFWLM